MKRNVLPEAGAVPVVIALLLLAGLVIATVAVAEVGAFRISPWQAGRDKLPADAVTMADLEVEVDIKGGFAAVRLRQVFENHTKLTLQGTYFLKLPSEATLMDFGVWDNGRWTEAVVIEREAGKKAFDDIVQRLVDPALMEAPEVELTDAFKVSVAPIPAHGTRRVEIAYHQWLPVRSGRRQFLLPLGAGPALSPDKVGRCRISIKVTDACPLGKIDLTAPMPIEFKPGPAGAAGLLCSSEAVYEGGPLLLESDLQMVIPQGMDQSRLSVLTYRDVETERVDLSATGGGRYRDETGFMLAEAIYRMEDAGDDPAGKGEKGARGRDVAVLFDASLSMQFEKLEKAVEVLERVLADLDAGDRFTLVLMGREADQWRRTMGPATPREKSRSLEYLRRVPLTGGTSLQEGFTRSLELLVSGSSGKTGQVIAITDGRATLGEIGHEAILEAVRKKNVGKKGMPAASINVFGIGEDANVPLLRDLAGDSGGYFIWARETEDLGLKIEAFVAAMNDVPVRGVELLSEPDKIFHRIYPPGPISAFNNESVSWVGRYRKPRERALVRVAGTRGEEPVVLETEVGLPEQNAEHEFIRRLWAERRVAHLLGRIRAEGESELWMGEIVNLSKQYKFPTPYTSYLVAPRAFLRPRIIRPADPVLRVRAEPGTRSVLALFPFGEVRPMRYLEGQDLFETRFIVPEWMRDGSYQCRLVITDEAGHKRMELKEFIVDSTPPRLRVLLGDVEAVPGAVIELAVDADPDTRRIRVRLAGLPAVDVRWDPEARINKGRIAVPSGWAPGEYELEVWAEDFAHNITSMKTSLRVGG